MLGMTISSYRQKERVKKSATVLCKRKPLIAFPWAFSPRTQFRGEAGIHFSAAPGAAANRNILQTDQRFVPRTDGPRLSAGAARFFHKLKRRCRKLW
jgi:hypothetical protein